MADTEIQQDRQCTKCCETKPITEFYPRNERPIGRQSQCRRCMNLGNQRRLKTPEARAVRAASMRKWRETNKAHVSNYHFALRLKKSYGISRQEYDAFLARQNNGCAICDQVHSETKRLCVDHCHATGKVRGLLCNSCNLGLGKLGDTIEAIERAAAYLREDISAPK
jgi:hypothetical protein